MKALLLVVSMTSMAVPLDAAARDDHKMFPLADALNAPAALEKLDKGIKLYFGDAKHPPVAKTLGEWSTNKKTNAFGKSDDEACKWVFLSAAMTLQERARNEGGNAVINIRSNYKKIETSSESEYMCGSGALIAGVAFKGTVVKLVE